MKFFTLCYIFLIATIAAAKCGNAEITNPPTSPNLVNSSYIGFKDFWPVPINIENFVWNGELNTGDELETSYNVATRMNDFLHRYIVQGKLEIINIEYPSYSLYSLRLRDQRKRNAPLAVSIDENRDSWKDYTIVNVNVWRVNYITNDLEVFKVLTPNEKETVEFSSAIRYGIHTMALVSCIATFFLF